MVRKSLLYFLFVLCPAAPVYPAILINEIMYNPDTLRVEEEFIELYNAGTEATDLSGWQISRGIEFTFPANSVIPANGYAVIAASPLDFASKYAAISVFGPFNGRLSNEGEMLRLEDATGTVVDSVHYLDELGWAVEADGLGASLERLNPEMPSGYPHSWAAGPPNGTPGQANLNHSALPFPIVTAVTQTPVAPKPEDPVTFTCQIVHRKALLSVFLNFKDELGQDYFALEMDAVQPGIYQAEVPPFPDGAIVEFFITATDSDNQVGVFPRNYPENTSVYLVESRDFASEIPVYRIVMKRSLEQILRSRTPTSNDELYGTFIAGNEVFYNVLIRFRGKGSRFNEPKNYRINFSNSRYFSGIRKLNLNAANPDRQYIGLESFKRIGLPTPEKQSVSVVFNQAFVREYIQIERVDKEMMQRVFDNDEGNLYRGVEQGNLDYRGEDKNFYRGNYAKETNELEDDYSDVIRLCEAMSNPDDATYIEGISRWINIRQWIRWFALKQVLNDQEGGLSKERGDDYFMYHNPDDGLFYLLPWDQDSVIVDPISPVHHHSTAAVARFLRHPDLARFYYADILDILENHLTVEVMDGIIDSASSISDAARMTYLKDQYRRQWNFNYQSIPKDLTVRASADGVGNPVFFVRGDDEWRFYRGRSNPPGGNLQWTQVEYDDSSWESGPGGFGYGDNDDRTVLQDMRNNYLTVFIRKDFTIASADDYSQLVLSVNVDDGFVAYLNGNEIARFNVNGEPRFQSRANSAGEPQVMDFPLPTALLQPGRNVLSMIGVNAEANSSDLSLEAQLVGIEKQQDVVQLSGVADAVNTRYIHVNGQEADYTPWRAAWQLLAPLQNGRNVYRVEALNAAREVIGSTFTVVYSGVEPPTDADELYFDTVWRREDSPVVLQRNLFVPNDVTLTIEAGVTVQLANRVSLIAQGGLLVNGTTDAPVRFTPLETGQPWGALGIHRATKPVVIRGAEFDSASSTTFRNINYSGAVSIRQSSATVEDCYFHNNPGVCVDADQSRLYVRGSRFISVGEGVHSNRGFAIVENNIFDGIIGYNDAIDFDFEDGEPSIVRNNRMMNGDDDCVDIGYASTIIEGNFMYNFADKGVSMEGTGSPSVFNNVIVKVDIGVAVKDDCEGTLTHNTIIQSTTGVYVYEKNAGQGGATASVVNTLVWDATASVGVDGKSHIVVRNSNLNRLPVSLEESNLSIEPLFVNAQEFDFHLQSVSPLIDAGVDTNLSYDFDGTPRPQGKAPDIGAFELEPETTIDSWQIHP